MTINVLFTGLPQVGTSTLFQVVTASSSSSNHKSPLHAAFDHVLCSDITWKHLINNLSILEEIDVLILVFIQALSQDELDLVAEQTQRGKSVILVHTRMSDRVKESSHLESFTQEIRHQTVQSLNQLGVPVVSVYCVEGQGFWDFNFEEAGFLFDLYHLCQCRSVNLRKEQILRRGSPRAAMQRRGILALVSFDCESRSTRNRFLKWWFPSPIRLEFQLFELSLGPKDLTVAQLKRALLKKHLGDADFIIILASESLLNSEGRRTAQNLVEACWQCQEFLPTTAVVSVVTSELCPKVVDNYPTSFIISVPVTPAKSPLQKEIVHRIESMSTSKDSGLLLISRCAAILAEANVFRLVAVLNWVAYWYTHYTTVYLLSLAYITVMCSMVSIMAVLLYA